MGACHAVLCLLLLLLSPRCSLPGNPSAAFEFFQRAVDVTPAMAARVASALRRAGVEYLVAPFEADAQCAYLARSGAVAGVITEDSDLVAHGVPLVLLKLDSKNGSCVELRADALHRCSELNLAGFTQDTLLQLCVLSGCDYLPSLPGVGVKKAHALLRRFTTAASVIRHLRFEGAAVPKGYEQRVQDAVWTFKHQWVFCPVAGHCVHVTPLPEGGLPPGKIEELLGVAPGPDIARGIAEARLCPVTHEPFKARALTCAHDASDV